VGLVDHGEHAEGHAHAAHLNAAWPEGKIGDSTHGILECGDLAASFGHGAKTYGADRQTIEKDLVQTFGAGGQAAFRWAACACPSACSP